MAVPRGGVKLISIDVVNATTIDMTVNVATSAKSGPRTVVVTNPDGGTGDASVISIG